MAVEYYELPSWNPAAIQDIKLQHTRELVRAIERNADAKLVQVLVSADGTAEGLVVDLCCDDIPHRNPHGLRSPERFAFLVGHDSGRLPAAFALRKDFPNVMHLNSAPPGTPRSLCLYFEPTRSVMRTWTAAKYLQRVQWWLSSTARGTLHAADQPVELPFFDSGWEVVIPADFDELRQRPDIRLVLSAVGPNHLDGSATLRLQAVPAGAAKTEFGFAAIDCPAIIHGHRREIPATLGALVDELNGYGIDLKKLLCATLQDGVDEKGVPENVGSERFVVLLNIPVCRAPGSEPEHMQRLALLTIAGHHELGLKLGAYTHFDHKIFRSVIFTQQSPI